MDSITNIPGYKSGYNFYNYHGETITKFKPISGSWGSGRDHTSGDQTAYMDETGSILWPNGAFDQGTIPTDWKIEIDTSYEIASEETKMFSILIHIGKPEFSPPSWTEGDMEHGEEENYTVQIYNFLGHFPVQQDISKIGEDLFFQIRKPNLIITEVVDEVKFDTLVGPSGTGYCTSILLETHFALTQSDTVGSYNIGLLDSESIPFDIHLTIYWNGSGWYIDEDKTTNYRNYQSC